MKTTAWIIGSCAAAAVAFFMGSLLMPIGQAIATTKVVNDSSETLSSVSLNYETCGNTASITSGELVSGQARRFAYYLCGEGGYAVAVVFQDGRKLRSVEQYVEVRDATAVHVTKDGITSR